jgi:gliding motility-associated-like protein
VLPHAYAWNGPDGFQSVSDSIFDLDFGTYYVTVTDLNSCYLTDSSVMDQDPTLVLEIVVNNPITCYGYSDGTLEINASQGLEPYSYEWNNGSSTKIISNLATGNYSVTVTDDKDCKGVWMIDFEEPENILLDAVIDPVSCHAYSDGRITLDATGGNGDYTFRWENIQVQGNVVDSLLSGIYLADIYDYKNCHSDTTIFIPQPEPLEIVIENIKQSFCPDWGDGEITITIEGGTPAYSYVWQDYPDVNGPVLSDIMPGWYFVSVTDANNCLSDSTIRVTSQSNVCLDIPTAFTPGNNDRVNDYWDVTYVDENHQSHKFYDIYPQARVLIYNRWGKLVFEGDISKSYDDGNGIWDGKDNSNRDLPVDSYYYLIYLNNIVNVEPVKGTITIIR